MDLINKTYDNVARLVISQLEKHGIKYDEAETGGHTDRDYSVEIIKPNLIGAFRRELGWMLNTKVTDDWYISAIYDVVHLLFFEREDKFLGKFEKNYSKGTGTAPFHGYMKIPLTRACQQVSARYVTQWKKFRKMLTDEDYITHTQNPTPAQVERYDDEFVDFLKTTIEDYDKAINQLKEDYSKAKKGKKDIEKAIKNLEIKKQEVINQLEDYEKSVTEIEKQTVDEYEPETHTEQAEYDDLIEKIHQSLTSDDQISLFNALLDGYTQTEWGKEKGYGKKKVINIKKQLIENIKSVDDDIAHAIDNIQS